MSGYFDSHDKRIAGLFRLLIVARDWNVRRTFLRSHPEIEKLAQLLPACSLHVPLELLSRHLLTGVVFPEFVHRFVEQVGSQQQPQFMKYQHALAGGLSTPIVRLGSPFDF